MAAYSLSSRAAADLSGIYEYTILNFFHIATIVGEANERQACSLCEPSKATAGWMSNRGIVNSLEKRG